LKSTETQHQFDNPLRVLLFQQFRLVEEH